MISIIDESIHRPIIQHMKKHGKKYVKAAGTGAGAIGLYHLAAAASSADDAEDAREEAKEHAEKSKYKAALGKHHQREADKSGRLDSIYHSAAAKEYKLRALKHKLESEKEQAEAKKEQADISKHLKKSTVPLGVATGAGAALLHMKDKKIGGYQTKSSGDGKQ